MPNEYDKHLRGIFAAGLSDDAMLQKFYEKDDLLTQTLDKVLTFARTLEGAKESIMVMQDNSKTACQYVSWSPRKAILAGKGTSKTTSANCSCACFICRAKEHFLGSCLLRLHCNATFCQGYGKYGHVEGSSLSGRNVAHRKVPRNNRT